MEEELLLVRIFFTDGGIETRPVNRVLFTTIDDFDEEGEGFLSDAESRVTKQGEIFVVFLEKVRNFQVFKGTFVDANKQSRHPRQDQRGSR